MLQLEVTTTDAGETVLAAAGRVVGDGVDLLAGELARLVGSGATVVVDLTDVRFLDRRGVELLRGCPGRGVGLRGGSLFVRASLGIPSTGPDPATGDRAAGCSPLPD